MWTKHWGIARRCRAVVREFDLPRPFSLDGFRAALGARHGPGRPPRPVHLEPLPTPSDPETPSGMWLATPRADYVFYDSQTSEHHRIRIILHEAGHMMFRHDGLALEDDHYLHRKLAAGDPAWARQALLRVRYTDRQEVEAEVFADLMWQRIVAESGGPPDATPLSGLVAAVGFHDTVGKVAPWR